MSKILVVFGATGQQGGSVIDCVIHDPQLFKQYKIRGVTRDLLKHDAQSLQEKGIEIVKGDFDNKESLKQAMQAAHTVFSMTATAYDRQTMERWITKGKALANTAVTAGVEYLI
jgi:uncharacterized protein YbjT (DUF2867 family)